MSSKLAELAGANELRGKVCVTDLQGTTHQYDDEASACVAWDSKVGSLEHRRGAFFETAGLERVAATVVEPKAVEPEAPTPPPPAEIEPTEGKPTEKKRSGRKRRS